MKTYEEFQRELRKRKGERWVKILAAEPPGPVPCRRARDPEKERLLLRLDRERIRRRRSVGLEVPRT